LYKVGQWQHGKECASRIAQDFDAIASFRQLAELTRREIEPDLTEKFPLSNCTAR
jgi:hypothetical protein